MFFPRLFYNLSVYLTVSVVLVAVVGDYLTSANNNPLVKALCDNITHALIGGLCWFISYLNREYREKTGNSLRKGLLEILSCAVLSSVIDLDHFFAAKSLFLKDATRLRHRPLLHCSTFPLVLFAILLLISYILESVPFKRGALILLMAFTTHHIRDATRRGLWFYPYGSTAPIPYGLYVTLTCMVPYLIVFFDKFFKVEGYRGSSDYFDVI